jgi:hypothetical protein
MGLMLISLFRAPHGSSFIVSSSVGIGFSVSSVSTAADDAAFLLF